MAYRYAGYQYETSPRKLKPEYEPKKNPYSKNKSTTVKSKQKQSAKKQNMHAKAVLYLLIGFTILFAISYRNSLINESFNRNEKLKTQLSSLQKENAQQKINIESSLNLSNIEKSASSLLGMKKLDETQKAYVALPKKDYVELASEQVVVTEEKSWFEEILEKITNLF